MGRRAKRWTALNPSRTTYALMVPAALLCAHSGCSEPAYGDTTHSEQHAAEQALVMAALEVPCQRCGKWLVKGVWHDCPDPGPRA